MCLLETSFLYGIPETSKNPIIPPFPGTSWRFSPVTSRQYGFIYIEYCKILKNIISKGIMAKKVGNLGGGGAKDGLCRQ